jgi:hypothetical protein
MRTSLLVFVAILVAAASAVPGGAAGKGEVIALPRSLADYTTWHRLTPDGYSVPPQRSTLCVSIASPTPPKSAEAYGPHANTFVRVFANPLADAALKSRGNFPEGSVLVKEKLADGRSDTRSAHGVMIKRHKGFNPTTADWEFLFYPSERSASFTNCADCHRSAQHDFVLGSYPGS